MSELDLSKWSFYNPLGDCSYLITPLGQFSVSIPAGVSHDQWGSNRNAPRLRQVAKNTNFTLEIKIDSPLTIANQGIGILVEQNENNLIRFDVYFNGTDYKLLAATMVNGAMGLKLNAVVAGLTMPFRLRVERVGNQWAFWTSPDGIAWTSRVSFDHIIVVTYGSIHATTGVNNPALNALIDYFHVDTKRGPLVGDLLGIPGNEDILIGVGKTEISGVASLFEYDFDSESYTDSGVFVGGVLVAGDLSVIDPSVDSGAIQGKTLISGGMVAQESADQFLCSGSVAAGDTFIGYLLATESADTMVSTGTVAIAGDIDAAETDIDTAVLTGQVEISGDIDAVEVPDVMIAIGKVEISGDVELTPPPDDSFAAVAKTLAGGSLLAPETTYDSADITAKTIVTGNLIGIEPIDTFIATMIRLFTAVMNAIESPDQLIATGKTAVSGQMAATDNRDGFSAAGIVRWPDITGSMTAQSPVDSAIITGNVIAGGSLSPLAVPVDTMAVTAKTAISGILSAAEQMHDTSEMDGDVIVSGSAALTEPQDSFNAAGIVRWPDIIGSMVAVENYQDSFSAQMMALISADLAAHELADDYIIDGDVLIDGQLYGPETADSVVIALRKNTGWLAGTVEVKPALTAIMKVNDAA